MSSIPLARDLLCSLRDCKQKDVSIPAVNGNVQKKWKTGVSCPIIPWRFFDWSYLIAIADEIAHPRGAGEKTVLPLKLHNFSAAAEHIA